MAMWRLEVQDLALLLIPLALLYLRIRSKDLKRRLNLSFHRTLHKRLAIRSESFAFGTRELRFPTTQLYEGFPNPDLFAIR